MSLKALGYLGANAVDLKEWKDYACDIFGAQVVDESPDQLKLRLDDKHHRMTIYKADAPGPRYFGWDAGSRGGLADIVERLNRRGCDLTEGTVRESDDRQVMGLMKVNDPSGNALEIFYGQKSGYPFQPARPMAGFRIGDMGLGHVVFMTNVLDKMLDFYGELGLRMSDYIIMHAFGDAKAHFLHCNPRHHSFAIVPGPHNVFHHVMLEVNRLDDVGTAYDMVSSRKINITQTLGKHTNDHMISFYSQTPSGFELEYGCNGRTIDDEDAWNIVEYDATSYWGHIGPANPAH
jgi:2,3-dihydroxybiphenyl 1,2-dioxygenase